MRKFLLLLLPLCLLPVLALAQAPTGDPVVEEAINLGKELVKAARGGDWNLVAVSSLTLLVWFARKLAFLKKIPPDYLPWVTVGTAVVTVIAANLQAGWGWWQSISGGAVTGLAASGFWSLAGKHILKYLEPKKAPETISG